MTRIGIVGYGNLGRGVECAVRQNKDMELVAVFTRRSADTVRILTENVPVEPLSRIGEWKERVDVLILCMGSATDLPLLTPQLAADFDVVDSFDNHAHIGEHFAAVDAAALRGGNLAVISAGWDPGLFSLSRLISGAVLPEGRDDTFWGTGVSQGHSDAARRIPGVADARQYTIPVEAAMERVRRGEMPELTAREKHTRLCYVVAEDGADTAAIEKAICEMPDYFAPYDTTVKFISAEEMREKHSGLPHGGSVLRSGVTGWEGEHRQSIEYRLALDSNPEFTASVLVAVARAVAKMKARGETGCRSIFDLTPADLSPLSREEMLKIL